MSISHQITRLGIAAASVLALALGPAAAQNYPERAIDFIVPFNPGGGADASQRTFNKYAEPIVGQPLVIVNKPGAGGTAGWAEMVRAEPDGYSLAIVTPPFNVIPALARPQQTGYTLDQFTYICVYAVVPDVLLVREDSEYETLADLIEYAKANPGQIKAANTGTLGADFMTTLLIEKATGMEFTQIPFTGGAEALQGTLAGTTEVMVASSLFAVAQQGTLRTLAIAAPERDPNIPDVPTFAELGYDVVSERYRVLGGPPGLPQEIVDYWADVCQQVTSDESFRTEMNDLGQPPAYRGPAEAKASIDAMQGDMQALVDAYDLAE
jgi:tripartite-type tricarboxylate transporter receptor subunit TctC